MANDPARLPLRSDSGWKVVVFSLCTERGGEEMPDTKGVLLGCL
jgi:hypothetical protein